MSKEPLKAGDRVRVFMHATGGTAVRNATVEAPGAQQTPNGELNVWVCLDEPVDVDGLNESRLWVHVKQVRRLVPRKRREWTVCVAYKKGSQYFSVRSGESVASGTMLTVREVKP